MPSLFWDSTLAELSLILEAKNKQKEGFWEIARFVVFRFFQLKVKNPKTLRLADILPLPSDIENKPKVSTERVMSESEYKALIENRIKLMQNLKPQKEHG